MSNQPQNLSSLVPTKAPGVFEMLKIGIGPSSSHTLGPWRAAQRFAQSLISSFDVGQIARVWVELYGSLALTGKGHGTPIALMLGLSGYDPVTIPLEFIEQEPKRIEREKNLNLAGQRTIPFSPNQDILYHKDKQLPNHANGMMFYAQSSDGSILRENRAYSIGGGFVVFDGDDQEINPRLVPFDVTTGKQLQKYCQTQNASIAQIARANELTSMSESKLSDGLAEIARIMVAATHRGCQAKGLLPGELQVHRRAPDLIKRISKVDLSPDPQQWLSSLRETSPEFARTLKLVGTFAMAVNEENASFGRIVTAPTNGSAGVIPAVLLYFQYLSGKDVSNQDIENFLLVAGVIGGIFKTGATISAAMGGCQAEIGVSSAMAAAALTEGLGGTPEQAVMAAEIAMEHHLGLTCDPIGGLVQIPCIERNSMGAIKAITAAHIALESDTSRAKVTLDAVVKTMWDTAQDMNHRYKETSLGGLAVNVPVSVPEC
jgi:L-serine dehydratase